jgi:hypothetical protein
MLSSQFLPASRYGCSSLVQAVPSRSRSSHCLVICGLTRGQVGYPGRRARWTLVEQYANHAGDLGDAVREPGADGSERQDEDRRNQQRHQGGGQGAVPLQPPDQPGVERPGRERQNQGPEQSGQKRPQHGQAADPRISSRAMTTICSMRSCEPMARRLQAVVAHDARWRSPAEIPLEPSERLTRLSAWAGAVSKR